MEQIQIHSHISASTEGFWNEPSPQDAEHLLLYEPWLASPNPSMLTGDGMPSCSQRTHDLDPANFFENTKCSGTPLGASNIVSFETFIFFDDSDVPSLEEEVLDQPGIIEGRSTPLKRARCQDRLEVMKQRRTITRRTKQPPKKDKRKMKECAETTEQSEGVPGLLMETSERSSIGRKKALGWCKCKNSQCLMLYCDCFLNEKQCGLECKCTKCQNTDHGNSSEGAATKARAAIRERRPDAFDGRKVKVGEGCSCPKNRCLKKYCACLAAGLSCDSDRCICSDCHNQFEVADSNNAKIGSFNESSTKVEKGEKEGIFDSSLDVPARLPDYDETELFHAEQGLRIAPDNISTAEV